MFTAAREYLVVRHRDQMSVSEREVHHGVAELQFVHRLVEAVADLLALVTFLDLRVPSRFSVPPTDRGTRMKFLSPRFLLMIPRIISDPTNDSENP